MNNAYLVLPCFSFAHNYNLLQIRCLWFVVAPHGLALTVWVRRKVLIIQQNQQLNSCIKFRESSGVICGIPFLTSYVLDCDVKKCGFHFL